jgi:TolB-like protein
MRVSQVFFACLALSNAAAARAEDLPAVARRVADSLATVLAESADHASVTKVAILPFQETGVAAGQGAFAAELLGARFAQAAKVTVLDRAALTAIFGEQKLQVMLGRGRPDDPELAAKAGVRAIITGQLTAEGEKIRVQARLALVGSGKALGSAQGTAEAARAAAAAGATATVRTGPAESGAIEVAIRRMADGLAGGFARLPGNARYRRLAVLTFAEVGERAQKRRLGTIVAAELATVLRRDHGLLLVERERLNQVFGEMKLQQMASPDSGQASKIGQLADAQALVIGSVAEAGDRYLVTTRIVATQTGENLAAESASLADAAMVAVASDAVVLRSRGEAAVRSLVPGGGQFYNRQPAKGWAFMGATAGLLGGAVAFHLAGNAAYSKYKTATNPGSASRLYDQANTRYQVRDWLLAGAGGAWVLGIVDAYASGVDGQALLGGGVAQAGSGLSPVVQAGPGVLVAGAALRF